MDSVEGRPLLQDMPQHTLWSFWESQEAQRSLSWIRWKHQQQQLWIHCTSCSGEPKSTWQGNVRWNLVEIILKKLTRPHHTSLSATTNLPWPKTASTIFWTCSWFSPAQGARVPALSFTRGTTESVNFLSVPGGRNLTCTQPFQGHPCQHA